MKRCVQVAVVVVRVRVQLLWNQVFQLLYCEMTLVPQNGNANLTRGGACWGTGACEEGGSGGDARRSAWRSRWEMEMELVGIWELWWKEGGDLLRRIIKVGQSKQHFFYFCFRVDLFQKKMKLFYGYLCCCIIYSTPSS